MNKYCLIALDMDGTLTNDRKKITPKTREVLIKAQEEGARIVLASARPSPGLFRERDILELRRYKGLLMSYNGGRIVDAATDQVLFETAMDRQMTKDLLRFLDTLPVTVILDDGKIFYVKDAKGYKVDYECRNNQMTCREVPDLAEALTFSAVKILMSADPDHILKIQKQIADWIPEELTVVRTAPFYLEVIPSSINKGKGIEDICRTIGITPEEVICFGDSENDLPMIRTCGMGVAMANADPEVKAAADYVTSSNNEDGVAAAVEKFILA